MRKLLAAGAVLVTAAAVAVPVAIAGSPHFINSAFQLSIDGNTLTVSGKEAGLGDELQIEVTVTADAACINPGGNHPKAGNKESFSATGLFPVQNGKADFSLELTATFQPDCTPPMTVVWSNITVVDETNGLTKNL
ncbi:MAG: hypothetical protein ACRDNP_13805 [Gaiellaceae bacterium]